MSNNNCAILTYTNSNCSDVWPIYFGQLHKHAHFLQSYILSDIPVPTHCKANFIYNNSDPYFIQWLSGLERIEEEYVIYAQEDFILYDSVDQVALEEYFDYLNKHPEYSYIRPIRCGFDNSLMHVEQDLFEVPQSSDDIFQMQITIWRKPDLQKLFAHVKSQKWFESNAWRQGCRDLNIRGLFTYRGEPKRGKYHYDSSTYPYVCTAVSRGKWNMNEYADIMQSLFSAYNVDPSKRGIRTDYNYNK